MATTVIHKRFSAIFKIEDADVAAEKIERILSIVNWEAQPTLFRVDTKKAYDVDKRETIVTEQRLTLVMIFHEAEILLAKNILEKLTDILGEPV